MVYRSQGSSWVSDKQHAPQNPGNIPIKGVNEHEKAKEKHFQSWLTFNLKKPIQF